MSEPVEAIKASTVVPIRLNAEGQFQVLLLQRNSRLDFAAGSWVFPGGRVSEEDFLADEIDMLKAAGIRETKEESGLTLNPKSLIFISHWTTPHGVPKRYATWFFLAEMTHLDAVVDVDGSEIVDHLWVNPSFALEQHRESKIELLPPAFVTLSELSMFETPQQAIEFYSQREVPYILPKVSFLDEDVIMLYPGDQGYETCDPTIEGARHRVVMHANAWSYESDLTH